MKLNFVISNGMQSKIFQAIFSYFKIFLPKAITLSISHRPKPGMDIYHYHRAHLEKGFQPRSVVTLHHDLNDTNPWLHRFKIETHLSAVGKIVCLNLSQIKYFESRGLRQIALIPHGVNKHVFTQHKRSMPSGRLQIGIISKRYQRRVKGEAYLFELVKRLNPDYVAFTLIGEGREVEYYYLKTLGYEVSFYECLAYAQYNQLYQYIDILMIPSLYEGGPASVPEALYTRTPILAKRVGMAADVILEGQNGFFLSGEVDRDAALIHALSNNEDEMMARLIREINQGYPNVMSWEDVVMKYMQIYESIFGSLVCN